ncbi:hypothetical protein HRED_03289 [Candidatus Haloredivivus sp. G17]|nr:hypothetical protein HRED_03289 [Candidatus Haloredivivus sp. G17]
MPEMNVEELSPEADKVEITGKISELPTPRAVSTRYGQKKIVTVVFEDDYRETVRIELQEESGIEPEKIDAIKDLGKTVSWKYTQDGQEYSKKYKAFRVEVSNIERVDTSENPCDEHEHGFFL